MKISSESLYTAVIFALFFVLQGCSPSTPEPITINGITVPPVPDLDTQRVAHGEMLYSQYCADCHGAELEGTPDWKSTLPDGSLPPPPHNDDGHTWHHSDDFLIEVIAKGGAQAYGGNMPGFEGQLTTSEIEMILDFIKSKWGQEAREFQWWVSAQ